MGISSPHRSPLPRIKHLLKVQTTPSKQAAPTSANSSIAPLPASVLAEIARHCYLLRDVLNFSLTCRRVRAALLPLLYSTVELKTNKQCKTVLTSLAKHPEIAEHVKTLIVRPNSAAWTPSGDELDEAIVAELIMRAASDLEYLETFTWDGLEMPEDTLWLVLRTSCPLLKRISTTIGEDPLNAASHLYDFSGLIQLGVTVKCRSYDWLSDGPPSVEKLPRRFWQMLLERSPYLEELTIGGTAPSQRIFDVRHVTAGRWPHLRQLTLGDMAIQPNFKDEEQSMKDDHAFMKFLDAHPRLQTLHLQHAGGSITFPPSFALPPSALPEVESFSGPLKYVKTLPHLRLLKHLTLTCLHHTVSSFPPTCATLQELSSLLSLNIWINLSFGGRMSVHDDGQMFRSILGCCPGLLHLEVLCFTRPTFHIKEFSQALRGSPQLESFVLTKIHKSSDEDMLRSAIRLVHDNPNLKQFTLRYSFDSWLSQSGGRLKQLGSYHVVHGADGVPTSLVAYEWGVKTFGSDYTRSYVQPLSSLPGSGGSGSETWSPRSSLSSNRSRASKLSRSSR